MKYTYVLISLFISNILFAQNVLKFNTPYYESINKYLILNKKPGDSTYFFGYMSAEKKAGLKFISGGVLREEKGKLTVVESFDDNLSIVKLGTVIPDVCLLSNNFLPSIQSFVDKIEALNKVKQSPFDDLVAIGNNLNHVGKYNLALKYLDSAYAINPSDADLLYEMAFSYNELNKPLETIQLLDKAKISTDDYLLSKELAFAYLVSGNIDSAEKNYLKAIESSKNPLENTEMAVNMALQFSRLKNLEKYGKWRKIVMQNTKEDSNYAKLIAKIDESLKE